MKVHQDLEYENESEQQKLDLYLPSNTPGPHPLVIFIHGGAWQFGDKRDGNERDWLSLVNRGYALASINYRLNDEVKFPEGFLDCKRALDFLVKNADKYNLDTDRIAVSGASAGGYYALMLATAKDDEKFKIPNESKCDIKSCVSLFAPTDFYAGKRSVIGSLLNRIKYSVSINITENFFGRSLKELNRRELLEASPIHYISKNLPSILLQQGDNDFVIPREQADSFSRRADRKGIGDNVQVEIFNGARHMDSMFFSDDNMNRIGDFLDETVKVLTK